MMATASLPSPSSSTPSTSAPGHANQGTAEGANENEAPPNGSSGTSDGVTPDDSVDSLGDDGGHYQSSPGGSSAEEDNGSSSGEGVIKLGVLQSSSGDFATRTSGIASTADAHGNVIPVPTSSGRAGNPVGGSSSSSMRIGVGVGVAAAVMVILTVLFILRRRRTAKRRDAHHRWWSSRHRSVTTDYDDEKAMRTESPTTSPFSLPNNPTSRRTSIFPTPPPVAEVRRASNLIDHPTPASPNSPSEARFSTGSLISFASATSSNALPPISFTTVTLSEESASYHHYRPTQNTSPPPSSDEHSAFPPPRVPEEAAIDRTSAYFQPRSPTLSRSSSIISGSTEPTSPSDSVTRTLNIHISSSTGHECDPFADPTPYDISDLPQTQYTQDRANPRYSASNSIESNPFSSGCGSVIASSCYNNIEEFEKVYVPFIGNLSDELSLRRGDEVRVLKIFEDGWALVVRNIQDGAQDAERGVIPASCLSERLAGTTWLDHPPRVDSYTMSAYMG